MNRVAVKPNLIQWALNRAQLSASDLASKFPELADWGHEGVFPTFKQLEDFAKTTRVPFGYLFLPEPPDIPLPIADFRTIGVQSPSPSPELLDTIYAMQRRQTWMKETRLECEAEPLDFIGSARIGDNALAIGREMRRALRLEDGWAAKVANWQAAVSLLRESIESLGVIAIINGVVGNNTHRALNVAEFRGFALSDKYAPLIFVNGADAKSAQMFTLAHELAHLWLGAEGSGLSGFQGIFPDGGSVEVFCDQAAAEFLVPESELRAIWQSVKRDASPFETLASRFKVSPIVIGRRAMDLRLVDRQAFFEFYDDYVNRERKKKNDRAGGGDFYNNQNTRVGTQFALQVIRAAKEGRIGFKEAYELTGLNGGAFQDYAKRLGMDLPR